MPLSLRSFATVLTVACLGLMLAGCSARGSLDGPGLNIPGPPAYLVTVKVPYGTATTDARELAIQRRHALDEANGRISRGRAAWIKMQKGVARK